MKRTRFARRGGLTRDAEQLTKLALGLAQSASRVEDEYWSAHLATLVDRLLAASNEDALNAALDQLWRDDARAYDELADFIEAGAECGHHGDDGDTYDVLLFAAPLLAWSRFSIPADVISGSVVQTLKVQLGAHVFAAGTKIELANFLFSPDQLPRGYSETRQLRERLTAGLFGRDPAAVDTSELPQTTNFLSDTRYLIGVVAAPRGTPLMRWQETDGSREHAGNQWRSQGGGVLVPLLPACAVEVLLPNAYHAACREADRASRPYSLAASVSFLETVLNVKADRLRAVIAPFYDKRLEEYRIGFTLGDANEVVHGVVWALLGAEDEETDVLGEIETVLHKCGVSDILVLEDRMPMEYCDECGAPLYPDPEGQPVHAELPEDEVQPPAHLH
ncbi:MAG: DUF2863 family protein [Rhodocyclaceae bacterium]|nr:DUF2863 family protein [Rhodocyclaceae bacterium]